MIYTLFFSRLRDMSETALAEYRRYAEEIAARAREQHPGFVDLVTYTADGGERLSVVRFTDEEAQRAWAADPKHEEAQARGRRDFYEHFRIVVCEPVRDRAWQRDGTDRDPLSNRLTGTASSHPGASEGITESLVAGPDVPSPGPAARGGRT